MKQVRELLTWASRGPVAASVLAVVLIALVLVEFLRPRQEVASPAPGGQSAGSERDSAPPEGFVDVPLPLRALRGVALDRPLAAREELVVDRGVKEDTALLGVAARARRVTVSPLVPGEGSQLSDPISFETKLPAQAVQVGALDDKPVAFAISSSGPTAVVETHDLREGGRLLDSTDSRPIGRALGATRDARIATWSGPEPDLFLLDRGAPKGTMAVRILSGESGYRQLLLDTEVAQASGFPPRRWALDVGQVDGDRPDIFLVTTGPPTGSGSTEVHILSGETKYSRFLMQVSSTLPVRTPTRRTALGYRDGSPTWFSAVEGRRRLQPFRLRAPKRRGG